MSPPPDGVFVSTPRIVGWTERTYRLFSNIIQVFTLFMKAIFSRVRHPSHPGRGHGSLTCHMTQFERSDWLRSANFTNIMIECVSNHHRLDCSFDSLYMQSTKSTSKLRIIGPLLGAVCYSAPGGFSPTRACNAWWRHQMEFFFFRVTGPLYGEFTGHRWIPLTEASDAEFWRFFICARINGWVNNREAGDLRRHRVHYDVIVMTDSTCMQWRHRVQQVHLRCLACR